MAEFYRSHTQMLVPPMLPPGPLLFPPLPSSSPLPPGGRQPICFRVFLPVFLFTQVNRCWLASYSPSFLGKYRSWHLRGTSLHFAFSSNILGSLHFNNATFSSPCFVAALHNPCALVASEQSGSSRLWESLNTHYL